MSIKGIYTLYSGNRLTKFKESAPSVNKITNRGLDALVAGFNTNVRFHVGKSLVEHGTEQQKLGDPLRLVTGSSPNATFVNSRLGDMWRTRITATFLPGQLTGEITEVGFNNLLAGYSQDMFSLAKVKDAEGNFSYHDVLLDEELTVVYDAYVKPSTLDTVGTASIRGVNRQYRLSAYDPDSELWAISNPRCPTEGFTEDPLGDTIATLTIRQQPYVLGSYRQGVYFTIPVGEQEEIKSIHFYNGGHYRLEFDEPILKEANEEIEFGTIDNPFIFFSWGRV